MMTTVNVMRDGEIVTVDAAEYPEPGVNLAKIRAATTIDRVDFAEALFDDGQLTEAELLEWAGGNVPSSVDANLSAILSGADLAKARARVKSAQTVNRMNDIVLLLQAARSLTDTQVDGYFGIST